MNERTPKKRKIRFLGAMAGVLCVACVVALVGLCKFFLLADQIYEPDRAGKQTALEQSDTHRQSFADGTVHAAEDEAEPARSPAQPDTGTAKGKGMLGLLRSLESSQPKNKETKTFLLLGVDSRKGEQARADTILLATVPRYGGEVHLMSIPRDTYVHVKEHGYTKINHAMSYGGLPLMKRTVEEFLSTPVDHTITVDFDGFRQLVDELGGLDLEVEKNMDYDDPTDGTNIHLKKGQTLKDGKEALDYARFRHDSEADTGRMRRQQEVIRAMIQKGSEPSNWSRMFRLADIVGEHVKTDLPPAEWMHLIMAYADTQPGQIRTLQLQGRNLISKRDRLWYFFVDDTEKRQVSRQLQQLRRGNE